MTNISLFYAVAMKSYTVAGTAVDLSTIGFSAQEIGLAKRVIISVETNDIRISFTVGTDPTSSLGHLLKKDGHYQLDIANMSALKLIRVSSSATVQITLSR